MHTNPGQKGFVTLLPLKIPIQNLSANWLLPSAAFPSLYELYDLPFSRPQYG